MEVCAIVAQGRGAAHALSQLGRYMDDLEVALSGDPEFRREYEMALRLRDEKIENALHKRAMKGNVPAIKFWLTNRRGEEWVETRTTRHVGHNGGAIEVEHTAAALRQVLTSGETRDDALEWIERNSIIDTTAVPRGELAAGEDPEPGEAG